MNISIDNAIIAILIANPLQMLFEILCLMLMKMKVNTESAQQNCNLLAFQCMMTLIFVYLVAQTTWDIQYLIGSHRDALVIVYTYIFAFLVDQVKSVGSHIIIYFVVVRRFVYLKENLKDFSHKDAEKS